MAFKVLLRSKTGDIYRDTVIPSVTQYQRLNRLSKFNEIQYGRYSHKFVEETQIS